MAANKEWIDKVHEITNELEHGAALKKAGEEAKIKAYHEGYVQACEDFCKRMRSVIYLQPTIKAVPVDRNGIIDEFAQKAIERLEDIGCEAWRKDILAIAEEMKGGGE